jgi:hypothetical protein
MNKESDQFYSLVRNRLKLAKFYFLGVLGEYSQSNIGVSVPISTFMRLWVIYIAYSAGGNM